MRILSEEGTEEKIRSEEILVLRQENFSKPSHVPKQYHDEEFFMNWENKRPKENDLCRVIY